MVSALGVATLSSVLAVAAALQLNTAAITANHSGPGANEFCIRGRLAPKFFLLGAPKSGTTFFFEDFARSKGLAHYRPIDEPDWHAKEPWVFTGTHAGKHKGAWLRHYPKCEAARDMVAVDCTPGYFGDKNAPRHIRGAFPISRRPLLVFMVFLREPIARSHSHYYQFLDNGVKNGAFKLCKPEEFPASFQEAAIALISSPNNTICNCDCNYMFSNSFYTDAFKRFFHTFDPSQFHIVPFQLAVGHEIVKYTWDLLNIPPGQGKKGDLAGDGNPENHHSYPTLEKEMDAVTLTVFKKFMERKTGAKAVAKMLARTKANLFKFNGRRTGENVAHWLEDHWH